MALSEATQLSLSDIEEKLRVLQEEMDQDLSEGLYAFIPHQVRSAVDHYIGDMVLDMHKCRSSAWYLQGKDNLMRALALSVKAVEDIYHGYKAMNPEDDHRDSNLSNKLNNSFSYLALAQNDYFGPSARYSSYFYNVKKHKGFTYNVFAKPSEQNNTSKAYDFSNAESWLSENEYMNYAQMLTEQAVELKQTITKDDNAGLEALGMPFKRVQKTGKTNMFVVQAACMDFTGSLLRDLSDLEAMDALNSKYEFFCIATELMNCMNNFYEAIKEKNACRGRVPNALRQTVEALEKRCVESVRELRHMLGAYDLIGYFPETASVAGIGLLTEDSAIAKRRVDASGNAERLKISDDFVSVSDGGAVIGDAVVVNLRRAFTQRTVKATIAPQMNPLTPPGQVRLRIQDGVPGLYEAGRFYDFDVKDVRLG